MNNITSLHTYVIIQCTSLPVCNVRKKVNVKQKSMCSSMSVLGRDFREGKLSESPAVRWDPRTRGLLTGVRHCSLKCHQPQVKPHLPATQSHKIPKRAHSSFTWLWHAAPGNSAAVTTVHLCKAQLGSRLR